MTEKDNEVLIRQAIAAEADEAVHPGVVLAALRQGKRPRRRRRATLVAVAGFAVVAGVIAVVVPLISSRQAEVPPASEVAPPSMPTDQNVLLIGMDNVVRSDVMVLARLGADGSVRAVFMPRDTKTVLPDKRVGKLNTAYEMGRSAAIQAGRDPAGADDAGAKNLMAAVQTLTGVKVEHYVTLDMAKFDKLSTAIGGVEVCLAAATKDTSSGADFPAGRQILAGEKALSFVRQRHGLPNSDLDRLLRQQVFLRAVVTKLMNGKLTGGQQSPEALLGVIRETVRMDPGLNLVELAGRLASTTVVDTTMIPLARGDTDGNFLVDPAVVSAFTESFLAGKPTETSPLVQLLPGAPSSMPPNEIPCVR